MGVSENGGIRVPKLQGHPIFGQDARHGYSRVNLKMMRGETNLPCTEPLPHKK